MKKSLKIFLLVGLVQISSISIAYAEDKMGMDLVIKENLEKVLAVAETVKVNDKDSDNKDININITINVGADAEDIIKSDGQAKQAKKTKKINKAHKKSLKKIEFKPIVVKAKVKRTGFYIAPKFNYLYGNHRFIEGTTGRELASFQDSIGLAGAVGFKLGFLRLEGEYSKAGEKKDRRVSGIPFEMSKETELIFANVYIDFNKKGSRWSSYIGGGIGTGTVIMKAEDSISGKIRDADKMLAWNAGAGIVFNMTPSIALDLNYRYIRLEDVPSDLSNSGHINNMQTLLGLRFTF